MDAQGNCPRRRVAKELIDVGLAEMMPYGHLRLHPALSPALLRELNDDQRAKARAAWTAAMVQLTGFRYQQKFKDAQLSAVLTLLELPNLLAALDALSAALAEESAEAEQVVDMATSLEGLLAELGRPRALDRVVRVREEAAKKLGGWSHALYEAESAKIDRLLDAGRFGEAVEHTRALAGRATTAGEAAYAEAAYDLAMASAKLGRALRMSGDAEAALATLQDARERFSRLAASGNVSAQSMASICLTETGDCLRALARLDQAARAYEESSEPAKGLNDPRQEAVGKGQLGTVRMLQQRYGDALAAFHEAREIFEKLGEPGTVAVAWHKLLYPNVRDSCRGKTLAKANRGKLYLVWRYEMPNVVGTKGQVVIEKPIRDALQIKPGSIAVQNLVGDHVEVHFLPPEHDRSLHGALASYVEQTLPPEEWDEERAKAWAKDET